MSDLYDNHPISIALPPSKYKPHLRMERGIWKYAPGKSWDLNRSAQRWCALQNYGDWF